MSDEIQHTAQHNETPETPESEGVLSSMEVDASTRRERREAGRGMPRIQPNHVIVALLVAVAAAAALIAIDVAVSWGRIHPGVTVSGVDVGARTPASARAALLAAFEANAAQPVTVTSGDGEWKVSASDLGASLEVTASVDAAMAVGRTRGAAAMVADRFTAFFNGVEVDAQVSADADKLDEFLDGVEKSIQVPSTDASVSVDDGKAVFHPAKAGDALDRDRTAGALLDAFITTTRTVRAVIVPAPVRVSDDDARQAFQDAQKLIDGPVTVTYRGETLEVPAATVARWVRFDRIDAQGQPAAATSRTPDATGTAPVRQVLVASFDATRVGGAITTLTKGLGAKPKDASFAVSGGKVTIRPSKAGRGPDLAGLAKALAGACISESQRTAELSLVEVQPALTTEAARDMGISDKISSYTTYYPGSSSARINNIHTLADTFNAKLLAPGAVFSFNGTAGQRTAAKGYQEAPAIVNGKLVPQLGGGVCQVGTTFFNAVFFAGLPVVERRNHSFYISHYPKGRDATVSWGGPDFKFKNNTDGWILIRTSYTSSSLTISLYGTDPGYEVEYTTSDFTDVVPFRTQEIKDPTLRKGLRIVEDGGVNGGRVTVARKVYKGGELVRSDTFLSRYTAKTKVVRVGTKASTPSTSTP